MSHSILILFKGLPGVGKSTLAKELQQKLRYDLVIRDQIKEDLILQKVPTERIGIQSYKIMWQKIKTLLKKKQSCICDTNLAQPLAAQPLEEISQIRDVKIIILDCFCSVEGIHKQRLEGRKDQNLPNFFIKSWEHLQEHLQKNSISMEYSLPYPTIKVDVCTQYDLSTLIKEIQQLSTSA